MRCLEEALCLLIFTIVEGEPPTNDVEPHLELLVQNTSLLDLPEQVVHVPGFT